MYDAIIVGAGFAGAAGSASGSSHAVLSAGALVLAVRLMRIGRVPRSLAGFPVFRSRNIPAVMAIQRTMASAISFWERSFWKKAARRSRVMIRNLMLLENTFFLIWSSQSFLL